MHRHGYQGRKFRRDRDQRRALLKGLATQLIEHGEIKTTLPKAKDLVPYVEVLITKAKLADLHNRRQILAELTTVETTHKLIDVIAPQLKGRSSGHLKINKDGSRVGDNTPMATVSFVDTISDKAPKAAAKPVAKKPAVKKPATKKAKPAAKAVKA